jgi:hypothetical protein
MSARAYKRSWTLARIWHSEPQLAASGRTQPHPAAAAKIGYS